MPEHRLVHFVGGPLGGMVKWTDQTEWWDVRVATLFGVPSDVLTVTHYKWSAWQDVHLAVVKWNSDAFLRARHRQQPEFLEQARLELFERFDMPADDMSDADVLDAYNPTVEHGVCPFTGWTGRDVRAALTPMFRSSREVQAGELVYLNEDGTVS